MAEFKIAILVNGFHKPMGTFSKGYIEGLPFDKITVFGGLIPFFKIGTSRRKQKMIRYALTILSFKNDNLLKIYQKEILKRILKYHKTECVLVEFLNTAASIVDVCKELNIPVVANVLGYEVNERDTLTRFESKYKELAKNQTYVLPVAREMITKLKSFGFRNDRIIYSPIGADERYYKISPNYHSNIFFALGRFTETKSPQTTLKSFSEVVKLFPESKLIFGGDGELLNDCKLLVKKLKIENNVDFIGWISKEEHLEYLKQSFCFIQHSVTANNGDKEGTPVAIIEASAAGLPVVSTFHAGISDVVIHQKTGFLVEESYEKEMTDYMIKLFSDRAMVKKMGEAARKYSLDNNSLRKHLDDVVFLINKAVNENEFTKKT